MKCFDVIFNDNIKVPHNYPFWYYRFREGLCSQAESPKSWQWVAGNKVAHSNKQVRAPTRLVFPGNRALLIPVCKSECKSENWLFSHMILWWKYTGVNNIVNELDRWRHSGHGSKVLVVGYCSTVVCSQSWQNIVNTICKKWWCISLYG